MQRAANVISISNFASVVAALISHFDVEMIYFMYFDQYSSQSLSMLGTLQRFSYKSLRDHRGGNLRCYVRSYVKGIRAAGRHRS